MDDLGFIRLEENSDLWFTAKQVGSRHVSDAFETIVRAWGHPKLSLDEPGSHFGFVESGVVTLETSKSRFQLQQGMFFCASGALCLQGGRGLLITHPKHHTWLHIGGPVEQTGRLRYIDGCTDSLLLPPLIKGDPCLNLLHIPAGTRQTAHTHPSLRAGLIVAGRGECVTPRKRHALTAGTRFVIPAGAKHSFHTEQQPLLVVAYHPDSDFGPTHEQHPMINRTWICEAETKSSARKPLEENPLAP